MAKKFPFGAWNYLPLSESKVSDVDDWAECGLTVTTSPKINIESDDPRELLPYLDRAAELGLKLIINVWDLSYSTYVKKGAEEYEKKLRELHEIFKGHPALYGYVVGDEPTSAKYLDSTFQCIKVQKQMDPSLNPYINFSGPNTRALGPEYFGGRTYAEWLKHVAEESGATEFCFDEYCQTINNVDGYSGFFKTAKFHVEAAESAGADMWACLLSSAHLAYNVPTEAQYRWQINVAAALGCRGVFWFRFYDRDIAPDYYGSPINEFGYKTDSFYHLLTCQRRFNSHYGEILLRLKRKNTWIVGDPRGDYPIFKAGDHDYILHAKIDDTGVLSIFEDENGAEYLCVVNGCHKFCASCYVTVDPSKCILTELTKNGDIESPFDSDEYTAGDSVHKLSLFPAQLRLFRIDKK